MNDLLLYKVCAAGEWHAARKAGVYAGSADDLRDGYIHLSRRAQLPRTLAKFFAGRSDLVLIALPAKSVQSILRWEAASNGDLYPHLYGTLDPSSALWERPLSVGSDGCHVLPPEAV